MAKNLLSVFITFLLVLLNVQMPGFAQNNSQEEKLTGVTTILSNDVTLFEGTVGFDSVSADTVLPSGDYIYIPSGQTVSYNIEVTEEKTYILNLTGHIKDAYGYYDYNTADIALNGKMLRVFNVELTDGKKDVVTELRPFTLPVGTHTLSVRPRGNLYLKSFTIEPLVIKSETGQGPYRKIRIPSKIEAEDFDYATWKATDDFNESRKYRPDTGIDIYEIDKDELYVDLKKNESTQYTFTVDQDGVYGLYVMGFGGEKLRVYFDDYEKPVIKELPDDIKPTEFVKTYLEKGQHTIRLEADDKTVCIDYVQFKAASGEYVPIDNLGLVKENAQTENPVYKNLYISQNGNDAGTGEKESPFKTISRAKEEIARLAPNMTGDIVVNIESGYYELSEKEVFTNEHSGKNGFNVIFQGTDRNNPPLISGGREVEGWEKHNDYLWRAPVPSGIEHVRNLYINGSPATRARSKYLYSVANIYDDPASPYPMDGLYVSKSNFPKNLTNHDDIELVMPIEWTTQFVLVDAIDYNSPDGKNIFIKTDAESLNTYTNAATKPGKNKKFIIENAFELLDEPGEFYYNRADGYIYYYPYLAEDMTKADAYVGKSEQIFVVEGESKDKRAGNIIFDNLDIRYSAWNWPSEKGFFTIQGDVVSGSTVSGNGFLIPAAIEFKNSNNIKVLNSRIICHGMAGIGVPFASDYITIDGNLVADCSGSGISAGNSTTVSEENPMVGNVDITNNAIYRVAGEFRGSIGIITYYTHHINVQHNELNCLPYSGISLGWGWIHGQPEEYGYFTVKHNVIDSVMTSIRDGSHYYGLGPHRYSEISYNYMTNGDMDQSISGVYFDSGTKYGNAHHNVITNSPAWYHMSGYNWIFANRIHSSYSSIRRVKTYGDPESQYFEYATVLDTDEANWEQEAIDIKASAGLKGEYEYLHELAQEPEWKKNRLETASIDPFIPNNDKAGLWTEAEDFMSGENIGWYKITPKYEQNDYRPEEGVSLLRTAYFPNWVIDTNFDGEWVKYEIEVPVDGTYYVDLRYGHGYGDSPSCSRTNVWIDDIPVCEEKLLPGNDWSSLRQEKLGKIELKAGKHYLKLEILKSGFYIDAFRVHDGSIYAEEDVAWVNDNAPDYDEGIMVSEEEFLSK